MCCSVPAGKEKTSLVCQLHLIPKEDTERKGTKHLVLKHSLVRVIKRKDRKYECSTHPKRNSIPMFIIKRYRELLDATSRNYRVKTERKGLMYQVFQEKQSNVVYCICLLRIIILEKEREEDKEEEDKEDKENARSLTSDIYIVTLLLVSLFV